MVINGCLEVMDGMMKKTGYIRKLPLRTPAVEYASATESPNESGGA